MAGGIESNAGTGRGGGRRAAPVIDHLPGRVLRLARHLSGMTQRTFAQRMHLGHKFTGKIEAGLRRVEPFMLQDAARAAGMPETALIVLADVAGGRAKLNDEQRAWLAESLLSAALAGLRGEPRP